MLEALSSLIGRALRVGVAPNAVALVRISIWPHEPARLLGTARVDPVGSPAAMAAALAGLLAEHAARGWPLTIVVADELVRMWQVTPPENATRLADLQGAAALRFQALFGAGTSGWHVQANWSATQPFLAAAMPQALLNALAAAARAQRSPVVDIATQFVAVLNRFRRSVSAKTWFALVHGGVFSLAVFDGGSLAAIRATPMPANADHDWLEAFVAREALRAGLGCPERLHVDGTAPQGWVDAAGRLRFACTVSDDAIDPSWPPVARLALSGCRP